MSTVKTMAKRLKYADQELEKARKEFFDNATSMAYQNYYAALKKVNDLELQFGCSVSDIDRMIPAVADGSIEFN